MPSAGTAHQCFAGARPVWRLPLIEGSVKEVALDRGAEFEFAAQADDHADKARLVGVVCGQRLQFGDEIVEEASLGPRLKLCNWAGFGYHGLRMVIVSGIPLDNAGQKIDRLKLDR
jgi:hypothetical protein